ncbi:MAG: histidine phosphatase family protein [Proteobacteria bacterium]|nr:histidine phosphatase family protein [Pseudomonadota bacterium]
MTPQGSRTAVADLSAVPQPETPLEVQPSTAALRVILIRHGRPAIATSPRTSHSEFRDYIDAYEDAGLDPESAPPEELQDLLKELTAVFTSGRKRSHDSAKALAPKAELIADPLFAEAPLASPRIPLLRMKVPKWAVVARILWYAGYHPGLENFRRAKKRALEAADILVARANAEGVTALVAHGYFNFLIGAELGRRGFEKSGSHRARFWNAVIYEKKDSAISEEPRSPRRRSRRSRARPTVP